MTHNESLFVLSVAGLVALAGALTYKRWLWQWLHGHKHRVALYRIAPVLLWVVAGMAAFGVLALLD